MVFAVSPLDITPNSQYDADSAPNQPFNCGPTSVTNVIQYHKDRDPSINATRRLATTVDGRGTSTSERKLMLDRSGLPSSVRKMTPAAVKALLNGRRSFEMALKMSLIPLAIRVRPFPGSHSVQVVGKAVVGSESGILINNPDFHAARHEHSRYFYPDRVWIPAFLALGGWCVVPDADKVIPTRLPYRRACHTTAGVNLRSGPGTQYTKVTVVPAGYGFTSIQKESAGGAYSVVSRGTRTVRRDWLSFNFRGRLVWAARGFVREG